ncbi:MAG: DnaD domain protein [Clostridia bacterium]|nr:DnaD domain protein [Clostridia bacterium]
MPKYIYKLDTGVVLPLDIWQGASLDELRVLTFLMTDPDGFSDKDIAESTSLSTARVKSALALWREAGIVIKEDASRSAASHSSDDTTPTVRYEFEEREDTGSIYEESSVEVADSLRDESLKELYDEIAKMMGKPMLSTPEIKRIAVMHTQLKLTPEYILTLAAHMAASSTLSPYRLASKAERLVKTGTDTVEALEAFISANDKQSGTYYEVRRILGIWNRNLSEEERECIDRWTLTYGYGIGIINKAYDVNIHNRGERSMPYMDKVIEAWYKAGVKTAAEADEYIAKNKPVRTETASAQVAPRSKKKTAEVPAYSSFNSEDALKRALERSYRDDDN